jgi:hypothetical protein
VRYEKGYASVELLGVALFLASLAAWITHVVVCLKAGSWGFLIAGAIFFPVAIVHGVGCWFGAW